MLYYLLSLLSSKLSFLNVLRYITFRSGLAIFTAFLISFIIAPHIIKYFKKIQVKGQPIRLDGPESHLITKIGTPTMGGVIMLIPIILSTIFWADLKNMYVWNALFVTLSFGILGMIDDYLKLTKQNTKGVSGKKKMLFQFIIALISYIWLRENMENNFHSYLTFPFFKNFIIDLGWFYFIFVAIVIVGASNAVNITDGLDGLAIVPVIITASCFAIISYIVGNSIFSNYLIIHHVPGTGEIAIFCASIIGAGLGFLWFNAQPAQIFMGDTGSLALGGALAIVSVITKHEIVLAIIGGLFVIEALSVIIQVYYFKFTKGKRIFLMAPLHHHFEKKGWSESTIVVRFWIIAIIFAIIGMSTLKLR